MPDVSRHVLDGAADALLMAAILLRDLASAMPLDMQATMPPDIRDRLYWTGYQDAWERFPDDVKAASRARVLSNPAVVEARRIDSEGSR